MLRRRWISLLACVVLGVGLAVAMTLTATPQYASTARLFVSTTPSNAGEAYQGGLFSAERVRSYADLVSSHELAQQVIDEVQPDLSAAQLADRVGATVVPETVILEVTVTDPDPEQARALAQGYADQLTVLVRDLERPPGRRNAPIKATIVGEASYSDTPVSPRPWRNLGLGLGLGLLLGAAAVAVRELLDTSVSSREDIEAVSPGPVMGVIAYDPQARARPVVTAREPDAPRAEAFRVLRTNMQFVDVDSASKVLVITSSLSEEGKTTTAVNLAVAMAQAGRRTVLVECDLRRPSVAAVMDLDAAVGLTTVLLGTVGWREAVQQHAAGVDVLTSGAIPPNPAELVQTGAMRHLLTELRGVYDVVILDAPPLLPVTDSALLASQADGALMVVRSGRTTRDQLRHAVERLEHVNARLVGFVLSMVPPKRHASEYGYGYAYSYSGRTAAERRKLSEGGTPSPAPTTPDNPAVPR